MRVIGRQLEVMAVAFPVAVALAPGASGAIGPAVMKCMHWEDAMHISPGVGTVPSNQSVSAHGKVFGCNKAGGGGHYAATLQMSGATCANLAMSGTASFDWVNGTHSTAFLFFHPQSLEPNKVFVNGSVTSGAFQGLVVSAWLRFTQVFDGTGPNCSPTNKLQEVSFTNSQSLQLLIPTVTTTTQPVGPTSSVPRTTGPVTVPSTVPVTNLGGSTTSPATNPRVTVVFQGGGGPGPFGTQASPQGTLAFTGSRSGLVAMLGVEVLLVGAALACIDPSRRRRRFSRIANLRRTPKSFLKVTLPPTR
jgi:hypothetical protein